MHPFVVNLRISSSKRLHYLRAIGRGRWPLMRTVFRLTGRDLCSGYVKPAGVEIAKWGSAYGGWVVPKEHLGPGSVCFTAGVGTDVTFDEALLDHGCTVVAIDPTPEANAYVANHPIAKRDKFRLLDVGVWEEDKTMKFFVPKNEKHVSHSILNLQQTDDYFEARCQRLESIMSDTGHASIDLLKLDIEGAEYQVLESLIAGEVRPRVLCVEFDETYHPKDADYLERICEMVHKVVTCGYVMVALDARCNYTFLRNDSLT